MKRLTAGVLLVFAIPALAYINTSRLPYKGRPGELPLEVAIHFIKNQLGSQGQFNYRTLKMVQTSQPEAFDQVEITLVQDGLMGGSIKASRYRLQLSREQHTWTIHSLTREFTCRRGRKGWDPRPCP